MQKNVGEKNKNIKLIVTYHCSSERGKVEKQLKDLNEMKIRRDFICDNVCSVCHVHVHFM